MSSLNIAVIGAGYVGLVTATCLSDLGFSVKCTDNNPEVLEKLQHGIVPFFEPGLKDLLDKNTKEDRLSFVSSLEEAVRGANIVFVAVGTPQGPEGNADLVFVNQVVDALGTCLEEGAIVVLKSTVPVGTNRAIDGRFRQLTSRAIHVVSNPEFLREGSALEDFKTPDRIIIGSNNPEAARIMRHFYEGFGWEKIPLLIVNWETAELIKYASNSFLALKVGYINEITNLCDVSGANIQEVACGMGLDHRIGSDFLRPGPGYGGSCFPKDTEALVSLARSEGVDLSLIRTLIKSNSLRKKDMAQRIIAALGGDVRDKKLAIWGITFKAKTDDLRESPSLVILPALQEAGALLRVYDPQGVEKGAQIFEGVSWCLNPYEAASEAEAVVVLTEWDVFKTVDWNLLKKTLKDPLIIDLRNLYDPLLLRSLGFQYKGLGRG